MVSSSISWLGINVSRWYDNYILILSSLVAETLILFWERICSLSSDGSVLASHENPWFAISQHPPALEGMSHGLAKETEVNSHLFLPISLPFCALSMAVMTTATAFILQAQCIQHKKKIMIRTKDKKGPWLQKPPLSVYLPLNMWYIKKKKRQLFVLVIVNFLVVVIYNWTKS